VEANKIKLLEFIGSSKRIVYQRNYDWKYIEINLSAMQF